MTLTLKPIGPRDYSVRDDGQPIGRIRFADERAPAVWIWNVIIHIPTPSGLPIGTAQDLETAKAEFKAAWTAFKAKQTPESLAQAYKGMNLREDSD
ncbi:hypothetical protein [Bradyrhizobium liaoningense]|uniref:hypothetical protein n=1 Tax=Bradyrhizobium liaoningense TaxID=43992 RepID=UPI001BA52CA4|nr:hypothetical protein [Bradyrhizobium liaoningense]MBR1033048.1 hypothetical protein [Bradyrhizobium liaoningense]